MERWRTTALIVVGLAVVALGAWQYGRHHPFTQRVATDDTNLDSVNAASEDGTSNLNEDFVSTATVSLMVDFGNGRIEVYPEVVTTDITVLGALTSASTGADRPFALSADANGITALDGTSNTGALRWQFWINNQYGGAPGSTDVADGDILLVKYVKPQPSQTQNP